MTGDEYYKANIPPGTTVLKITYKGLICRLADGSITTIPFTFSDGSPIGEIPKYSASDEEVYLTPESFDLGPGRPNSECQSAGEECLKCIVRETCPWGKYFNLLENIQREWRDGK